MAKHEVKFDKTEDKTHTQNAQISEQNLLQKSSYSILCAVIWLVFEALLLYCIAYEWLYRVGAKNYIFDLQDAQSPLPATALPTKQSLQRPLQQGLQQFLNQDLQDAYNALAREKQEKQDALARRKQEKQDALARKQPPDFGGLVTALQGCELSATVLTNAFHVNLTHVNSAKALLGMRVSEPEKLRTTSEYNSVAKFLGVQVVPAKKPNYTLFDDKGGVIC